MCQTYSSWRHSVGAQTGKYEDTIMSSCPCPPFQLRFGPQERLQFLFEPKAFFFFLSFFFYFLFINFPDILTTLLKNKQTNQKKKKHYFHCYCLFALLLKESKREDLPLDIWQINWHCTQPANSSLNWLQVNDDWMFLKISLLLVSFSITNVVNIDGRYF